MQTKGNVNLTTGATIRGKWNGKRYTIIRRIGAGMIGTVYLCYDNNKKRALKISTDSLSITKEVNVLNELKRAQGAPLLGPVLFDADDWIDPNGKGFSFYVMEYIYGQRIEQFVRQQGTKWIGIFLLQMLEQLAHLHQSGWVFGDLKNENLIVSANSSLVRFIDVGGTTKLGRSVKEYSEFYDRAYWGQGTRVADPAYDLFAVVMVLLTIFYPNKFKRSGNPKEQLLLKIRAVEDLSLYRTCLQRAVLGKYATANSMKKDIIDLLLKKQKSNGQLPRKTTSYLIEAILVAFVTSIYYVILFLFQ